MYSHLLNLYFAVLNPVTFHFSILTKELLNFLLWSGFSAQLAIFLEHFFVLPIPT